MKARAQAILQRLLGWSDRRPAATLAILGLVVALGYPPLHLWWAALPALALAISILRKASNWRSAFWRGWVFGWAHLVLANNWIATAFTHQAKMPEFLGWLAVPLLCVYLAVYPALASLTAHWLARKATPLAYTAVFAGVWIVFEWMRSWVFTGYPWPPLGLLLLGAWDRPGLALLLPWMGTYALSGFAILCAGALTMVFGSRLRSVGMILVAAMAVAMLWPAQPGGQSGVRFTLVQPYIPQDEINDPSKFEIHFQRLAALTQMEREGPRVVLWPESAIPDFLEEGYPQQYYNAMTALNPETGRGDPEYAKSRIAQVIGPDATLLMGVVNLDIDQVGGRRTAVSARNSVVALDGSAQITDHYAKAHLVPYGEYLPMRPLLEPLGLTRLVAGTIDYKPGPGPATFRLEELGKAGVQICYEIVFSGRVVDRKDRPDYIFNPSNDGWFGWWGPPQHLAQARMRALEEGLPVLRSTTTGISAVIDAKGSVRQTIALGEAAALEGLIPKAHPPTLFARLGNALALGWAAFALFLGLIGPRLLALMKPRS
ncbi:MAG: apolipoprotein N-acyltransferase [Pseudomonadota bacterium]